MGSVVPLNQTGRSPFEALFYDLVDDITKVERSESGHELLADMARKYGLCNAAYLAVNAPGLTDKGPYVAVTYSDEWKQHYFSQNYVSIDPVVQIGLTRLLPLDWGALPRGKPILRRFFGEAADAGVGRQGLSFPIRGTQGELALFSITSDAGEAEWKDLKRLYMRDFQIIAHHIHMMVLRMTGAKRTDYSRALSARERECLQWAAAGKSTWETSVILGISERSVKFYLDQSRHKLDCLNKTHAVAKALSLGLIVPPG